MLNKIFTVTVFAFLFHAICLDSKPNNSVTLKKIQQSLGIGNFTFQAYNSSTLSEAPSGKLDTKFLQRLILWVTNLNTKNFSDQQIAELLAILVTFPNLNEMGNQLADVFQNAKQLAMENPAKLKNALLEIVQSLPLDKLTNDVGKSSPIVNEVISIFKNGQLPNLYESLLNPCNSLLNCNQIEIRFRQIKSIINFFDSGTFVDLLKNPNVYLNEILALNNIDLSFTKK